MEQVGSGFQVVVQEAIIATCTRRKTPISSNTEIFLEEGIQRYDKEIQWLAFIRKGQMGEIPEEFSIIMI